MALLAASIGPGDRDTTSSTDYIWSKKRSLILHGYDLHVLWSGMLSRLRPLVQVLENIRSICQLDLNIKPDIAFSAPSTRDAFQLSPGSVRFNPGQSFHTFLK